MTENGETFDRYVMPRQPISREATGITGLTYDGKYLYLDGRPVNAEPKAVVLKDFVKFLSDHAPCLMIAHNGHGFDERVLYQQICNNQLETFQSAVLGFTNTKVAFRKIHAEQKVAGQKVSLAQRDL